MSGLGAAQPLGHTEDGGAAVGLGEGRLALLRAKSMTRPVSSRSSLARPWPVSRRGLPGPGETLVASPYASASSSRTGVQKGPVLATCDEKLPVFSVDNAMATEVRSSPTRLSAAGLLSPPPSTPGAASGPGRPGQSSCLASGGAAGLPLLGQQEDLADGPNAVASRDRRGAGPARRRAVPGAAGRGLPVALRGARCRREAGPASSQASPRPDAWMFYSGPWPAGHARRDVPVRSRNCWPRWSRCAAAPTAAGGLWTSPTRCGTSRAVCVPRSPRPTGLRSGGAAGSGTSARRPARISSRGTPGGPRPRPGLPRGPGRLLLPRHVGLAAPGDAPAGLPGPRARAGQAARAVRSGRQVTAPGSGSCGRAAPCSSATSSWAPAVDRFAPVPVQPRVRRGHRRPRAAPHGGCSRPQDSSSGTAAQSTCWRWTPRRLLDRAAPAGRPGDWPPTETLVDDEEAVAACWAWEQFYLGMTITGTIHNESAPTPVPAGRRACGATAAPRRRAAAVAAGEPG